MFGHLTLDEVALLVKAKRPERQEEVMEFVAPWVRIDPGRHQPLLAELAVEVGPNHLLFGRELTPVARKTGVDDFLFQEVGTGVFWLVHLTWSRKQELDPRWPHAKRYASLEEWVQECMPPVPQIRHGKDAT